MATNSICIVDRITVEVFIRKGESLSDEDCEVVLDVLQDVDLVTIVKTRLEEYCPDLLSRLEVDFAD